MTAALAYRSRALAALAVALPIPLLAALGLSLPLPATVERLAAKLVPFADQAIVDATPSRGSIVAAPDERRAGAENVAGTGRALISLPGGRVVKTHGATATAGGAPGTKGRGDEARTSTTAAPKPALSPASSTAASTSPSAASQPNSGADGETTTEPGGTEPDPTPTPTPTPTPIDTVTTTANDAVSSVTDTATTVTDTAKDAADGVVGGLPHP